MTLPTTAIHGSEAPATAAALGPSPAASGALGGGPAGEEGPSEEPPRTRLRYTSPFDDWLSALAASEDADHLLATPGALAAVAACGGLLSPGLTPTPLPKPGPLLASTGLHSPLVASTGLDAPAQPAPGAAGALPSSAGPAPGAHGAALDVDAVPAPAGPAPVSPVHSVPHQTAAAATTTAATTTATAAASSPASVAQVTAAASTTAVSATPAPPAPAAPTVPAPAPKGPTTWGPSFGLPTRPTVPTFGWQPRATSTAPTTAGSLPLNSWFLSNGMPNFDRSRPGGGGAGLGGAAAAAAARRHSMPPTLASNSLWVPPGAATSLVSLSTGTGASSLTATPTPTPIPTPTSGAFAGGASGGVAAGAGGRPVSGAALPAAVPSRTVVALDVLGLPSSSSTAAPATSSSWASALTPPAWTKWFSPESDLELEARWQKQWDAIRSQDQQLRAQREREVAAEAVARVDGAGGGGDPQAFKSPRDLLLQVASTLHQERERAAEFESKLMADLQASLGRRA